MEQYNDLFDGLLRFSMALIFNFAFVPFHLFESLYFLFEFLSDVTACSNNLGFPANAKTDSYFFSSRKQYVEVQQ